MTQPLPLVQNNGKHLHVNGDGIQNSTMVETIATKLNWNDFKGLSGTVDNRKRN